MNNHIVAACIFFVGISILVVGYKIEILVKENTNSKIEKAYMLGIAAEPLILPTSVWAGKKYIIYSYIPSEGGEVTKLYRDYYEQTKYTGIR